MRNGIDVDIWDPSSDVALPVRYGVENVGEGKDAAKAMLRERLLLSELDVPIVGCVTRLVAQKVSVQMDATFKRSTAPVDSEIWLCPCPCHEKERLTKLPECRDGTHQVQGCYETVIS